MPGSCLEMSMQGRAQTPLFKFSEWCQSARLTQFKLHTAKLYNDQYTSNAIPGLSSGTSEIVEASPAPWTCIVSHKVQLSLSSKGKDTRRCAPTYFGGVDR